MYWSYPPINQHGNNIVIDTQDAAKTKNQNTISYPQTLPQKRKNRKSQLVPLSYVPIELLLMYSLFLFLGSVLRKIPKPASTVQCRYSLAFLQVSYVTTVGCLLLSCCFLTNSCWLVAKSSSSFMRNLST